MSRIGKRIFRAGVCLLSAGLAAACGDDDFKISGDIYGAEGESVVLEKADFSGSWVSVDSVKVGTGGRFAISAPVPASPEVYRLNLAGRYLYFPVEGKENLTLSTASDKFGAEYTLSGSAVAERMGAFDREMYKAAGLPHDSLASFKRHVYTEYIRDGKGSILSYYVLTKTIGNRPLFDPENPDDAKYFGAVATQYAQFAPDDPRTEMLRRVSEQAMRARNSGKGLKRVLSAGELSLIDVALPDEKGDTVRLSDIAGKGKPVLLVFSMMNSETSPVFNRAVSDFVKGRDVKVYQVSFDQDVYAWSEAARNLPWITVADPGSVSGVARDYNLGELPVFFVIDAKGNLVDRASDFKELASKM